MRNLVFVLFVSVFLLTVSCEKKVALVNDNDNSDDSVSDISDEADLNVIDEDKVVDDGDDNSDDSSDDVADLESEMLDDVDDETPDDVQDEDTDDVADEITDEDVPDGFNPEDPGYTVEFFFVDVAMMDQPTAMIVGYVMETAREDLDEEDVADTTLDTCFNR